MAIPADPTEPAADVVDADLAAAVLGHLDRIERYLGGILGVLQSQEGTASMLGDLAPMVMAALMSDRGPATHTIEGETVGH